MSLNRSPYENGWHISDRRISLLTVLLTERNQDMSQEVPLSEIRVTKYPNTQRNPKYPISNRRHHRPRSSSPLCCPNPLIDQTTRYWGYRNFLHIINNRLPEQSGALFQVVRLLSLLVAALRQVVHHSSFELLSGLGISSFVIVRYTTFGMETSSVTLNTTRSDMRPAFGGSLKLTCQAWTVRLFFPAVLRNV